MSVALDLSMIEATSTRLMAASAAASIRWTWETFGERCCILSSMQDLVIVDLATSVAPGIPVVFLDNGYHFESTLETLRRAEQRYHIDVEVVRPDKSPTGAIIPGACCDVKVELLSAALSKRQAWISGLQRSETPERADAPVVGLDRRGKVKVNPLAQWNDDDRSSYIAAHDVIEHPLLAAGYSSIGCAPCTSPATGEVRSGRWPNSDRTECGLHL